MRLWLKFCLIWAVFSLVWGPLTGPDTVKDRILHAFVPLILQLVTTPIIRALNFRRIYREHGMDVVYCMIGVWVFILYLFIGVEQFLGLSPQTTAKLSEIRIGILSYIIILTMLTSFFGPIIVAAFRVLRWLARHCFPEVFARGSSDTRSLEP